MRVLYFAKLADFFRKFALIKIFHNRDNKSEQRREIKAVYVGRENHNTSKLLRGIWSYGIEYEAAKQNKS